MSIKKKDLSKSYKAFALFIALASTFFASCCTKSDDTPKHAESPKSTSHENVLFATCVKVVDGDSITVLDSEKKEHKIRLLWIDAPERKQPFNDKSKQYLSGLVFNKTVKIEWTKKDRYQRTLGVVYVDGINCNKEMLKAGMAHHYRYYSKSKELQALEDEAKKARRGLWQDKNPVEPWAYRRKK